MQEKSLLLLIFILCLSPVVIASSNLTEGCIEDYVAGVDYFPQKVDIVEAERFTVEYHNHYKVIEVSDAFDGAPGFQYVLVQCGAPIPEASAFAADAQFIEVPVGDIVTLSTTQLPPLEDLGLLDHLVAVDSGTYISSSAVQDMLAQGDVAEVGFGAEINIEKVLELAPDVVMSYGYNPATDAHPVLLEAGIFTALDASWRESSPLGRAEWLKFAALFYNQEAQAEALFAQTAVEYAALRNLSASLDASERPSVLLNTFLGYADAWFVPGGETYIGQLLRDASAEALLSEADSAGSLSLSFESAYAGGRDAQHWLLETFGVYSLADLLAQDSRFGDFAAFETGTVWNNNRDENANGGNNIYELGVVKPQLVLADLIAIFHPELLPEHEFVFYQQMPSA